MADFRQKGLDNQGLVAAISSAGNS